MAQQSFVEGDRYPRQNQGAALHQLVDVESDARKAAFLREALSVAAMDLEGAARDAGPVFFDRGLIDAAAALQRLPVAAAIGRKGQGIDRPAVAADRARR